MTFTYEERTILNRRNLQKEEILKQIEATEKRIDELTIQRACTACIGNHLFSLYILRNELEETNEVIQQIKRRLKILAS